MVKINFSRTFFRFFMPVLAITLLVSGCKKGNNDDDGENNGGDNEYYVQFKTNGTSFTYKSNAIGQIMAKSNDNIYSCVLMGYNNFVEADKSLISLVIFSEEPISAKTYKNADFAEKADESMVPQLLITHYDASKTSYLSMGIPVSAVPPFDKIVSDAQVNITEIGNDNIKGTFSGTVYKTTDATFTQTLKITEGKFNLKKY